MADITEESRKKIYDQLANAMIEGMEKGELNDEESKKSAQCILENLDDLETEEELIEFLQELSDNWPSYKSTYDNIKMQTKAKNNQKHDETQIREIQDKLNQLIVNK